MRADCVFVEASFDCYHAEHFRSSQLIRCIAQGLRLAHVRDGISQVAIDFAEVFFFASRQYLLIAGEGEDEQDDKIEPCYQHDSYQYKLAETKLFPYDRIDKRQSHHKKQQACPQKSQRSDWRREVHIRVHLWSSILAASGSKRFTAQSYQAKKRVTQRLAIAHLVNDRFHVAQIVFESAPAGDG